MNRKYDTFNNICNIGEKSSFTSANSKSNLIFEWPGNDGVRHNQKRKIYTKQCAKTCLLAQKPSFATANLLSVGNINKNMLFTAGVSALEVAGQQSNMSQSYNAEKCAKNWDGHCELASQNTSIGLPNLLTVPGVNSVKNECPELLTQGQYIIYNALAEKYRLEMVGGIVSYVPYNPNVANSPLVKIYTKDPKAQIMFAVYGITNDQIKGLDSDPIMNRALQNPSLYEDILAEIYTTMGKNNRLSLLKGTKLGQYFNL